MAYLINSVDPFGDGSGVALYQLDGNANDTGGNYNGTWSGTEQYDTGKFGQAASFDGASNILLGNSADLFGDLDNNTFSFWVKNSVGGTSVMFILEVNSSGVANNERWYININNGVEGLISFAVGDATLGNATCTLPDKTNMHHVVCVSKQGTTSIYLNGQLVSEGGYTNAYTYTTQTTYIGYAASTGDRYFQGLIDQVRIFNRALTDYEVKILYQEYKLDMFMGSNVF